MIYYVGIFIMITYKDIYDSDDNTATTDVQSNELYLDMCSVHVPTALLKEPQPTHSLQSVHTYTSTLLVQTHKKHKPSPTNACIVIWQGSGQWHSCKPIFLMDSFVI